MPQPPGPRSSVVLRSVSKSYGDSVALHPTDLDVREGEFLSLLGPSGCGKTTTLKLIAGFEQPSSGSVVIGGEDASTLPPHKRDVNTVFQNYALFPHMNLRDNVAYGLKQRGVGRTERARQAMEALELVALADRGDSRPAALSGGQQQRVALARALVLRPSVLLLDEPLGALDLKLRQQMQIELKRIHREVGLTFIFVTHDQGEALSMSDRVAVLNAGRIEQLDAPQTVYDEPATPFVASFIGEMSRLHGTLRVDGTVSVPGAFDLVPGRVVEPAAVGAQVLVGVRPRDAQISRDEPANATVTDVMTIGHDVQIVATLDGGQDVVLVADRYQTSTDPTLPTPGARTRIEPIPGTALLLGTTSNPTHTKDEQR